MKILICGAQGQVGWELSRLCQQQGVDALALGSKELNIANQAQVNEQINFYQPSIVVNAAAYTAVDKAETESELAFRVNQEGPAYLASSCKALDIPLIHISTDYVFDGKKTGTYQVNDAINPLNVYGASKWGGEENVRKILAKHIILRTSWVFSSHGNNFVKTMLRLAQTRDSLSVVADQHGAPTSATSIAHRILTLCRRYDSEGDLPWGTYHFTGKPVSTWFDFAECIFKEAQTLGLIDHPMTVTPISTADYPTPAARPQNSALDLSALSRLNITAPSWQDDLIEALKILKST